MATIFASKAVVASVGGAIGGGTANSTQPVVTGTAAAGTYVNVYDGVRMIGTATVAANGTWTFTVPASLKGGNHSFTAIDVGTDGNFGAASTPMSVIIPASAPVVPPKPVINGMTDDQGHALTDPTNDAHPWINGTGVAGDTIALYDGNTLVGSATIGPDGQWKVKPTTDLSNGTHDLYVVDTSPAGVPSPQSDHKSVTIDTSTPATPSAPTVTDDSGAAIVPGVPTNDAHPHIDGKGVAGDIITVYDGNTVIGSTKVDGKHNTLKLSLTDVLNLGETDLFQQDGKQQMMVQGKEGDMVDLSNSHIAGLAEGEWEQHGTTQVGGVTYNVYEHSGAHTELLVQQGVQIAVH